MILSFRFFSLLQVYQPFSLNKGLAVGLSKTHIFRKAFKRMLILIVLGLLTQLPALSLTVLGAMAGDVLRFEWKD